MPDTKITALTALTAADPANDVLPIVDVSDTTMAASGTTKKISINNVLGCSGTATLASATITGNLTVDTNTLFVDSVNNRVGVLTASPAYAFSVAGRISYSTGIGEGADLTVSSSGTSLQFGLGSAWAQQLWYLAGSEAMRLNSTGLGVGGSPTRKLSIVGSGATYANINSGDNTSLVGLLLGGTSTPSAGQVIYDNTANSLALFTSGASRLLIDSTGNVGIGVSAFGTSAAKVLGLANATAPTTSPAGMGQLYVEAGALKYRGSSGTVTTIANA